MNDRFDACHPITAGWEGGWSNHPDDPGGATMYGVIQKVYDAYRKRKGLPIRSVRLITRTEALEIYRAEYWEKCGAPTLFPGVDLAVYDASVNSGVSRSIKWLKASVGSNDHSVTVKRICRVRLGFVQSLKIWKSFGKGWGRRIADIEAKGVAMALTAMGVAMSAQKAAFAGEATAAKKSAKANATTAAASSGAAGAGGGVTVSPLDLQMSDQMVLAVVVVALIGYALFLLVRARADKARADAYTEALA